jgi:hypothetical protein
LVQFVRLAAVNGLVTAVSGVSEQHDLPMLRGSTSEPTNGDVLANDDANNRVIVVDPRTNRVVWQYGHTHVAGSGAGYLDNPDGLDLYPPNSELVTRAATMGTVPQS